MDECKVMDKSEKRIYWLMMIAIFCGNFSAILSMATIMVPLPGLMKLFNTELGVIQWAITGFSLATGVIAPTVGYLCQRFGVKRTYIVTLIGFLGTSFLCAMAWNVYSLIAFRCIQGLFCGILIPVTMTIIYSYVKREEQAFSISLWSMSGVLAPALGPTIAGFIIDYLNWQWIFLMNVPICILAIILSLKFIPKDGARSSVQDKFDLPGMILGVMGTTLLLMGFSFAQSWGITDPKTLALVGMGILLIIIFVRTELKSATPLLDFRIFKFKSFAISSYGNAVTTLLLNCCIFLVPLYLQSIRGFSAVQTGMIIFVGPVAVAIVSPLVGKLYTRARAKKIVFMGLLGLFVGFGLLTQIGAETPIAYVMLALIILESGMGAMSVPVMNYGMEALPKALSGHGSGMTSWLKQGFSALAVGMITSTVLIRTNARLLLTDDYNAAYVGGMTDIFWTAVVGILIFAVSIFFWMQPQKDDQTK